MIIVRNRFIPPTGFAYINLFGVLFTRRVNNISDVDFCHEYIHTKQMRELLYIPFYVLYALEWLVRLIQYRDAHKAYRNISFEREAYAHQGELQAYLDGRKHYHWVRHILNNNKKI